MGRMDQGVLFLTKISVVIVNWNGRELLKKNLQHVLALRHPDFEVIVVDNGSQDDSASMLRTEFPAVRVVALPVNRGFAGGNNAALSHARGEFIATLNNDARPEPDWLDRLVDVASCEENVGICAGKLLVEGKPIIDSAGDRYSSVLLAEKRGAGESSDRYTEAEEVFSACAGAALYRRSMIEEIGFFDEEFFLVYEDVDLSFRARLARWKIHYVPSAVVHHACGSSLEHVPDTHVYHLYRNSEFVWIKNMPARLLCRYAAAACLQRLFEMAGALRRLRGRFPIYVKAKWNVLKRLPALLRRRRAIQNRRKVSPDSIARALTPVPFLSPSYWINEVRRVLRW